MYLLQERLGEDAVNRALSRFLARFRFKGAPYLRSTDLIDEFRKEAKTAEQQQLITDLFEQITLYDLKVTEATTRKRRRRLDHHADGRRPANIMPAARATRRPAQACLKPIEVGLFTARPGARGLLARRTSS